MANPFMTLPNINFSEKSTALNAKKVYDDGPKTPNRKIFPFWEYLNLSAATQQLVFIPGEYESRIEPGKIYPWLEFYKHKMTYTDSTGKQIFKNITCSAGSDKHHKKPCVGCHYYESNKPAPYTKKENRTPNPWGQKLSTIFCVGHLAWYKRVMRMKDGKPVVYADIPQYNEVLCPAGEEGGPDTFFGKLVKIELGNNHYKNWVEIASQLYWLCDGCGMGIVTKKVYCRNCGADLIDPKEINKLSRPQQEDILKKIQTCACGHVDMPVEDLACGYDVEGKVFKRKANRPCPLGDNPPQRMHIYNCVVSLNKTGAKTDSKLNLVDKASFNPDSDISWVTPYESIGMPVVEIIDSIIARNGGKLYDINKDIEVVSEEQQAQELKVPNPYAAPSDIPKQPPISQVPVTGGGFQKLGVIFNN